MCGWTILSLESYQGKLLKKQKHGVIQSRKILKSKSLI